jgi:hypothetical protein
MVVAVSYFNKKTREEFLASARYKLGKKDRCNLEAETVIVLSSLDERVVWGVCTLANWDGTDSPCREHHLLDQDIYSKEFAVCNKYEIHIKNLHVLKNPVSYDDIRILVGGPSGRTQANNMWQGFQCQFAPTFMTGEDKACVSRFNIWAQSLL